MLETWIPRLGVRGVVVADDEAARSPLARAAMTLALPPEVEGEVEPAAALDWAGLAASEAPSLVVVRSPADAERAFAAGMTPDRAPVLNLGNVHYSQGRRPITPSIFLSAPELDALRRLAAAGFRIEARAVPLDAPIDLAEIERRWNAAG